MEAIEDQPRLNPADDCEPFVRKPSRTTRAELRDYSDLVARRARNRDDTIIDCTDPERFGIVISKLFEIGRDRVAVYSDHLCRMSFTPGSEGTEIDGPYWSNPAVIRAAQEFLRRDHTLLEIAVANKLDCTDSDGLAGSDFLTGVITGADRKGTIFLYVSPNRLAGDRPLGDVNFVVSDDNGFRLEKTDDQAPAWTRFGRQHANRSLFNKFDEMADHFEQALDAGNRNCLKLVYTCADNSVMSPTAFRPDGTLSHLLEEFLIDQVKCPPTPNEVIWPGPGQLFKNPAPTPR